MERLGVLGLGRMGLPIAARLLAAGHRVTVFDPDTNRVQMAEAHGAIGVRTEQEVALWSDILVSILPGPSELRDAMLGPSGALSGLAAGASWLDLTSNDPRVATEVARAAHVAGVMSVGAPMAGGPSDAAGGSLRFYLGGSATAISRVTSVLLALGSHEDLIPTGPDIASGYTTKLLANTLWFGQVAAVTEALLLGQTLGLDLATLRSALVTSAGGSHFISQHLEALLEGDYLESFGIERIVEELDTVTDLAVAAGTPHGLTGVVADLHREALGVFGPVDGELLVAKLLEQKAGRTLRVRRARQLEGDGRTSD